MTSTMVVKVSCSSLAAAAWASEPGSRGSSRSSAVSATANEVRTTLVTSKRYVGSHTTSALGGGPLGLTAVAAAAAAAPAAAAAAAAAAVHRRCLR